jgi:hypothetical protein
MTLGNRQYQIILLQGLLFLLQSLWVIGEKEQEREIEIGIRQIDEKKLEIGRDNDISMKMIERYIKRDIQKELLIKAGKIGRDLKKEGKGWEKKEIDIERSQ